jgi:TfoX/Sxy family transcriptional regulator of competence genes
MFAGTFGKCVFVRLDEPSRVELLTAAGAKPFEPMEGRPMKEYVQLPESLLNEPLNVKAWLNGPSTGHRRCRQKAAREAARCRVEPVGPQFDERDDV